MYGALVAMSAVRDVLPVIRERIANLQGQGINEMSSRAVLINPMLKALGWDNEDLDQVQQEYDFQPSDNPVDYALMEGGKPSLYVEAKALGKDLGDRKWASQIMGYAIVAGVEWVVLTDGNEYRIYNTHAPVPVAEKLFHRVRVTDDDASVGEVLELLSRSGQPKDRLKAQWRAHFVDRQVQSALKRLFGPEPDMKFVDFLKAGAADLTDRDVAASLRRVRAQFEFPLVPDPLPPPPPPPPPRSRSVLRQIIEAGLIQPRFALHTTYKRQEITAHVEADGAVMFRGDSFSSLSSAAAAARRFVSGTPNARFPTNGWDFWRFTDADGQIKKIDVLRQRFLAKGGSDAS